MNIRLLFLSTLTLMPITNYSMMNKIKYYANPKTYNKMYCDLGDSTYKDASHELQEWGRRAQENVGMKHPVRIKIMSEDWKKKNWGGYVLGGFMFINDDVFNDKSISHGVKNHILHHEGIHLVEDHCSKRSKVAKMYCGAYCAQIGWLSAMLYDLHTPFMELNPHVMISASSLLAAASIASNYFITNKMNFAQESAADIKGAHATRCYRCVNEAAVNRITGWEMHQAMGYASYDRLHSIAEELRQQGKVCDYHKKNGGF